MHKKTFPLLAIFIFLVSTFIPYTPAFSAGIRFEGQQSHTQGTPQRLGGPKPGTTTAAAPISNLQKEAANLRARYRSQKAQNIKPNEESRYGVIAAFFDSDSLTKPRFIEGLNTLTATKGIKTALFLSKENTATPLEDTPLQQLEAIAELNLPFMRPDSGGRIARSYGITKFPTLLYETPNHEVIRFEKPASLDYVLRRIAKERGY